MRVVILSGLYPPHSRGGAEVVAARLASELTALGHTVSIITTGQQAGLENDHGRRVYLLSPANIFWYGEIARFPFLIRVIWHLFDIFNFWQARRVSEILKKEKPDLVWSHNLKGLGFLIPRALKKSEARHIHTLHDIQLIKASGVARVINFGVYGRLTHWLVGSPEMITSPSAWLLSLHQNFNFFKNSATYVWPHVFDDLKITAPRLKRGNKLLYLGQLEAAKGVPFLIETLSNEVKDLIIAGEGRLKNYCLKSRVDFRGYLTKEKLEQIWNEADFLIVPSLLLENSPTVILEAFSHGLTVIAANIGGIPELVADEVNGFLFKPGDSQSLKEAIIKAKAANYSALSQNALARYQALRQTHLKVMDEMMAPLS